jgi:hypothetical protein
MERMKFGWWYLRYAFTYEPMKAFGAWEDECKRQFPQYDTYSTLEMVDVYTDYCYQNLMPKSFIVSVIDAVSYAFLFNFRGTFYFLIVLKHKISYRIGSFLTKNKTEIIDVDVTDWE